MITIFMVKVLFGFGVLLSYTVSIFDFLWIPPRQKISALVCHCSVRRNSLYAILSSFAQEAQVAQKSFAPSISPLFAPTQVSSCRHPSDAGIGMGGQRIEGVLSGVKTHLR
jgi:hypothetical protein